MSVVEKIKEFVEIECKKPTSKFGYDPFKFHFEPMVKYADQLADEFGGDKEVILIAAWLHDIGSIVFGREDHHITGAKIAEEKLKEIKYPPEKIELIKKCIFNHRGSKKFDRPTIEEKIVSEADTMSNFDNIAGIFKVALVHEHLNQDEAKKSVRKKLENKWDQLSFDESKKIIKPKYEAVKILLE